MSGCLGVVLGLILSGGPLPRASSPTTQDTRARQESTPSPRLRGRIVGRGGAPASGLELLVRPAGLDDPGGRRGTGGEEFRLRTDLEGAFAVDRLERGTRYVVRARTAQDRGNLARYFSHLLTPEAVLPQVLESDPELVLTFSRPHVVVRLLDEEGRPWSGPEVHANAGDEELPGEWPRFPSTLLFDSVSAGTVTGALGLPLEGEPIARGVIVYELGPGARSLAGVLGGPFAASVQLVELPEDADRSLIELRARGLEELGTVRVRVVGRGIELGARGSDAQFTVVLQSLLGSVALLADGPYRHASPFLLRAPPGTYRVVARGYASIEGYHNGLERARELGQAEAVITIGPGATSEVQLELDTGGRLELSLEGAGTDAEFDSIPAAFLSQGKVHAVELLLVSPTGQVEGILRRVEGFFQPNLTVDWPLGETYLSECLPTGRATILARQKNGRETRVEVELREGETTRVKLSF